MKSHITFRRTSRFLLPVIAAAVVGLAPTLSAAQHEAHHMIDTRRTVTVSGEGVVDVEPDMAIVRFGYGIRTDTEVLRRGTSPADVEAYAFLQGRADQELLRRIGRPAFSETALRSVGAALAALRKRGDVAVAYVGRLDERASHVLPNLADFCLAIEGVAWSAAAGLVRDQLVINIRHIGGGLGAGDLASALAEEEGMGGGHRSMARCAINLRGEARFSEQPGDDAAADWLIDRVVQGVESLRAVR